MMNSYDTVNYKIRPQKQIERGLISQLVNTFSNFIGKRINYIGMGSLYFADFVFFNKNCTIDKMISIEKMMDNGEYNIQKEKRFNFNKPLSEIELIPKSVSEAIEDLPLSDNNFVWLDYDGQIEPYMINDLNEIIKKTLATSLIAITYNSGIASRYKSKQEIYIEKCEKEYRDFRTQDDTKKFDKDNYSELALEICEHYLMTKLQDYNNFYKRKMKFEKISNIKYQDGAKMNTIIWVLVDEAQLDSGLLIEKLRQCEISGDVNLTMQVLTLYEKQCLDRCNEKDKVNLIKQMGIDQSTVDKYYKYSKYIPENTEVYI